MASDVSMAFLMVMERLAPEERAAFLLREVFDVDYPEVAQMLGKSEATVRQAVHRARARVRESKPRFTVSRAAHIALLERFVNAARGGDQKRLAALFADDVRVTGDGGGKVVSILRPLHGTDRVVRFFHVIDRQHPGLEYRLAEINGSPSLLRYINGKLDAAQIMVTDGVKILEIYIVRNPDKLRGITG
jgi:RNA polymerase sigma-70 factor (ECF subfamily)